MSARTPAVSAGPVGPILTNSLRQQPLVDPFDVSAPRLDKLQLQLNAQLRPVLREQDLAQFDLDRAISIVRAVAAALAEA